jgi:hypothetical protein
MLDDQNLPDMSVAEQTSTPGPRRDISCTQEATTDGQASMVWGIHREGARRLTYCDYYCMMSLADYLAWCQKDDGSGPPISFSKQ